MVKYIQPITTPIPIIDNLTTPETTSALSANQGKVLNDKITTLSTTISNIVVDSLDGNEIDRSLSVHIVKESLTNKANLVDGKVPIENIPDDIVSLYQNNNSLSNICAGNGIIVTKGTSNRHVVSVAPSLEIITTKIQDSKKAKVSDTPYNYKDICYCDTINKFVAISDNNNKVVTSSDCKIWNEVTLPTSLSYTSVIYSSKLHKICIVAKNTNQLLISDDGNVFTTVTLPSLLDYVDVVAIDNIDSATGGMFIAISTGTTIVVSTNGTDWVEKTIPAPVNNGTWNAITYNDTSKQLVIVGSNGSILMSNSNITSNVDSIVFTSKNLSSNTVNLSDVCYSSVFGKYCAVVSNNSNKAYIRYWHTWNEVALSSSSNWIKVIYVPFYRAFFALSGSENKCAVSLDGITWKDINLPNTGSSTSKYSSVACSEQLNCMCMTIDGANKFVVVGIDVPFVLSTIR